MTVTARNPGDLVTAAIFNTKLESPILSTEIGGSAVTSPALATGAVTALKIARQPVCVVTRSTNQTGIVTATRTKVSFDAAEINSDNGWLISAPTRATVHAGGLYLCLGVIAFSAGATGVRQLEVLVNNVVSFALDVRPNAGASILSYLSGFTVCELAADDYVELVAYHEQGSNLSVLAGAPWTPRLSLIRLCT